RFAPATHQGYGRLVAVNNCGSLGVDQPDGVGSVLEQELKHPFIVAQRLAVGIRPFVPFGAVRRVRCFWKSGMVSSKKHGLPANLNSCFNLALGLAALSGWSTTLRGRNNHNQVACFVYMGRKRRQISLCRPFCDPAIWVECRSVAFAEE